MHAVTAWMVHPLTGILVGTKMKTEQPIKTTSFRYRMAKRLLQEYATLPSLSKKQLKKKAKREKMVFNFEKRIAMALAKQQKKPIKKELSKFEKQRKIDMSAHSRRFIAESRKMANFSNQDKNFERSPEEETDVMAFSAGSHSSFASSSWRKPDNLQLATGENFDIPSTSRCDNFEPKRQQIPNRRISDSDDDSSNGSVRYYPSNSPSRVLLVSKRALEYEMEHINENSQFMKSFGEEERREEMFSQLNFRRAIEEQEINRTLPDIEAFRFPRHRENFSPSDNDEFSSRNFDAIETLPTFSKNNYDRHKKERYTERYEEGSRLSPNLSVRENERFYERDSRYSQRHHSERERRDRHFREEHFYDRRNEYR